MVCFGKKGNPLLDTEMEDVHKTNNEALTALLILWILFGDVSYYGFTIQMVFF